MSSESGQSLVTVLVVVVILSLLVLSTQKFLVGAMRAERQIAKFTDLDIMKGTLFSQIDCAGTFATAGINALVPAGNCNSTSNVGGQVGPFLRLRRKTPDGTVRFLTGPLEADGTARFGGLRIRATCSEDEQSLIVRVESDPNIGFQGPKSLLFGTQGRSFPICFGDQGRGIKLERLQSGIISGNSTTLGSINLGSINYTPIGEMLELTTQALLTTTDSAGAMVVISVNGPNVSGYNSTHHYVGMTTTGLGAIAASSGFTVQFQNLVPGSNYTINARLQSTTPGKRVQSSSVRVRIKDYSHM